MSKLFTSYPNYEHLKGSIQRVWIHDTKDEGRNPDEETMVAHTKSYVKVLLKRIPELVGKQAIVKITDIFKWHVCADIIDASPKIINVNFQDHFKGVYNTTKTNETNQFTDIRKEQVDIHATIIETNTTNSNTNTELRANLEKNKLKDENNFKLSIILFILSVVFLCLGLNNILRDL